MPSIWLGHFDLWAEDGTVLFRHVLIFPDSHVSGANARPCCIWPWKPASITIRLSVRALGGKSAQEAMAAAVLECAGQA
jgi:hypothetical protein